jgi:hypothetical protein
VVFGDRVNVRWQRDDSFPLLLCIDFLLHRVKGQTMKTVLLCVAFYGLGVFNCAVFAAVYLLHRPRYVAPTMHNRKWKNAPGTEFQHVPPTVQMEAKATDDGVRYEWINIAGERE